MQFLGGNASLPHQISRPDIANVVCELSKCMEGPFLASYKEMLRVIKSVLDTKEYCLKLAPELEMKNGIWYHIIIVIGQAILKLILA
jgi:hypothetical protein